MAGAEELQTAAGESSEVTASGEMRSRAARDWLAGHTYARGPAIPRALQSNYWQIHIVQMQPKSRWVIISIDEAKMVKAICNNPCFNSNSLGLLIIIPHLVALLHCLVYWLWKTADCALIIIVAYSYCLQ